MITLEKINVLLNEEIIAAKKLFSGPWAHEPVMCANTFQHKRYLGLANSSGEISINSLFLNTSAVDLLVNTLKHEICHLIVGVHQNHNSKFKRVASVLGVKDNDELKELTLITSQIKYKYSVIAHMAGGKKVELGGVHRKTKKYTEYDPKGRRKMRIDGVLIERFEFLNN
ncbi:MULTISPECIES: SprT-like domain-containing protein [Pseudoalteromonas]|uniref:SprT-like domain-containing protein n=1 Tax=Pseudoalteromonas TaxID=53246 RepID=UPI0015842FBC|nr:MULTISPECIES: SprT-like domain-containing protein [Pseudoalteromonas]MDI4654223.1 SprT-like domain-containing protein [Pseudoalteromonas shioyasakiensis]NUJ40177.1 SprT-like domain-containing protein [Pseudoalteromonas sp. 0303]